jgi:isopentenyl diphosphate isomerase/L-lactate dehydrogenase-like FMN-dependent dehydrogenase
MHKKVENAFCIDDLRKIARVRLPRVIFDYMEGGAELESALSLNTSALERVRLLPHRLRNVSVRDQTTILFGKTYASPFGIGPVGLANLLRAGADEALARAAAQANVPFVLSTVASTSLEAIAEIAPEQLWFQLYVSADRRLVEDLLDRAWAVGVRVLVVTVDVPTPGRRARDFKNGFTLPLRLSLMSCLDVLRRPAWLWDAATTETPRLKNLEPYSRSRVRQTSLAALQASQIDPSLNRADIEVLRRKWGGSLVIKGIMSPADVRDLAEHGVDGIVISNHGGRQLDAAPATIDALPAIRESVGRRLTLLLDGGIRRGTDVVRALALGADGVLLGRAPLYGVAAGGMPGAVRALEILADELDGCMANVGCSAAKDLGREHIYCA